MARIAPLQGIRYDHQKLGPASHLVGPSRDIISDEEKEFFWQLHQFNFCHILHPKTPGGCDFSQSLEMLRQWRERGHLVRDPEPSIYIYQTRFRLETDPRPRVRTGFICLLGLEDYASGVIRPHERTFPAVKERLFESIKCCQANLSPIFTFYDDPAQEVMGMLWDAAEERPVCDFQDTEGIGHKIWRLSDRQAIAEAVRHLREVPFYIADGHHRYESCLAFWRHAREKQPGLQPPPDYTLAYAVAMQDPGLTLLPAHRLIKTINGLSALELLTRLEASFDITAHSLDPSSPGQLDQVMEELAACAGETTAFCMVAEELKHVYFLRLKPEALAGVDIHPVMEGLDVEVLSQLVLGKGLGLGRQDRGNENLFIFESNYHKAVERVKRQHAKIGFLVNPTRIEQVKAVADAGLYMPRKSSNFYPKVAAGLVINQMEPPPEAGGSPA